MEVHELVASMIIFWFMLVNRTVTSSCNNQSGYDDMFSTNIECLPDAIRISWSIDGTIDYHVTLLLECTYGNVTINGGEQVYDTSTITDHKGEVFFDTKFLQENDAVTNGGRCTVYGCLQDIIRYQFKNVHNNSCVYNISDEDPSTQNTRILPDSNLPHSQATFTHSPSILTSTRILPDSSLSYSQATSTIISHSPSTHYYLHNSKLDIFATPTNSLVSVEQTRHQFPTSISSYMYSMISTPPHLSSKTSIASSKVFRNIIILLATIVFSLLSCTAGFIAVITIKKKNNISKRTKFIIEAWSKLAVEENIDPYFTPIQIESDNGVLKNESMSSIVEYLAIYKDTILNNETEVDSFIRTEYNKKTVRNVEQPSTSYDVKSYLTSSRCQFLDRSMSVVVLPQKDEESGIFSATKSFKSLQSVNAYLPDTRASCEIKNYCKHDDTTAFVFYDSTTTMDLQNANCYTREISHLGNRVEDMFSIDDDNSDIGSLVLSEIGNTSDDHSLANIEGSRVIFTFPSSCDISDQISDWTDTEQSFQEQPQDKINQLDERLTEINLILNPDHFDPL